MVIRKIVGMFLIALITSFAITATIQYLQVYNTHNVYYTYKKVEMLIKVYDFKGITHILFPRLSIGLGCANTMMTQCCALFVP